MCCVGTRHRTTSKARTLRSASQRQNAADRDQQRPRAGMGDAIVQRRCRNRLATDGRHQIWPRSKIVARIGAQDGVDRCARSLHRANNSRAAARPRRVFQLHPGRKRERRAAPARGSTSASRGRCRPRIHRLFHAHASPGKARLDAEQERPGTQVISDSRNSDHADLARARIRRARRAGRNRAAARCWPGPARSGRARRRPSAERPACPALHQKHMKNIPSIVEKCLAAEASAAQQRCVVVQIHARATMTSG